MASYWKSQEAPVMPQEFVYGFTNYQGAVCTEAVIYNYGQGGVGLTNYSRDFAILVSMNGVDFTTVTNGVLPMSEYPVVVGMGGVTCRQVKLVLSSGYSSNACELAEFELHGDLTADPDGDGMNDAWEMAYFGNLGQQAANDYDADDLNNLNEFVLGANPTNSDSNHDGVPDGWAVQYGLHVTENIGTGDTDGDGLSDFGEFIAGSNPTNPASTFLLAEPVKIGTWMENISWDESINQWSTGTYMRVDGFVFSWSTVSGRVYQLNSSTNLLGAWQHVSEQYQGMGSDITVTNWSTNSIQRFYQLQVEMP
jgi:hypothetical protein